MLSATSSACERTFSYVVPPPRDIVIAGWDGKLVCSWDFNGGVNFPKSSIVQCKTYTWTINNHGRGSWAGINKP